MYTLEAPPPPQTPQAVALAAVQKHLASGAPAGQLQAVVAAAQAQATQANALAQAQAAQMGLALDVPRLLAAEYGRVLNRKRKQRQVPPKWVLTAPCSVQGSSDRLPFSEEEHG